MRAKPPSEPSREPSEPPAGPAPATDEAAQASDRGAAPRQSDGIDLIIDKLPRHGLVKPIPVTIAPLGDRVFVASTPDLDITVTGNSLSDALLLLKQQLESTYESLRAHLERDDAERGTRGNRLFYLAVPPAEFDGIVAGLRDANLVSPPNASGTPPPTR